MGDSLCSSLVQADVPYDNKQQAAEMSHSPPVRDSVHALGAAADLTGAPPFAASLPPVPLPPLGAPAGGAPVQVLPRRGLRRGAAAAGILVARRGTGGGRVGGHGAGARPHGLGDHLELVGARLVLLLLVLHAAVVLEEELAGLLQHPAALSDGAVGQRTRSGWGQTAPHGTWTRGRRRRLTLSCGSC